jgi:hypothetical protein
VAGQDVGPAEPRQLIAGRPAASGWLAPGRRGRVIWGAGWAVVVGKQKARDRPFCSVIQLAAGTGRAALHRDSGAVTRLEIGWRCQVRAARVLRQWRAARLARASRVRLAAAAAVTGRSDTLPGAVASCPARMARMMASAAVAPVPARAAAAGAYPERAGSHRLRDPVAAMADRAAALTAFRPARDWYLLLLGGDQRARLRIPSRTAPVWVSAIRAVMASGLGRSHAAGHPRSPS